MSENENQPAQPVKYTILVVDDSESVRHQVMESLGPAGYEIFEAEDGKAALKTLEGEQHFDLVLCDIHMPRMDGMEFLENVSERIATEDLAVVMLTTDGNPSLIRRARRLGAKGWMLKPVNAKQLRAVTERLLAA